MSFNNNKNFYNKRRFNRLTFGVKKIIGKA